MIHPCALTVAGSDSGGNAGVQADLRTFHDYGLHGCTVFAALTAQNPFGVSAIHPVPPAFIRAQLDAVLGTYAIRALKTGMLADAGAIDVIADSLRPYPEIAKVIDPVMVATSGAKLIRDDAVEALKRHLLPLATVITPNIPEAEVLSGRPVTDRASACAAAEALRDRFGAAVIVKGGHAFSEQAEDILCDESGIQTFSVPRLKDPVSTHGTGCTFAAAITAGLTLGRPLPEAVREAKTYVYKAIAGSCCVGPDCGVLGFVR